MRSFDFMPGHLKIGLGIAFGAFLQGKFSDGVLYAIEQGKTLIFRDDWLDTIFSMAAVHLSVKDICNPGQSA